MRNVSFALAVAASLSLLACGPRDEDKLGDDALASAAGGGGSEPDTRCAAQSAQDEVKRQLFARAAEIRGSNAADFASIAGFALIQLDGAMPDVRGGVGRMVECRGRATLRLPAGLSVAGGRTAIGGDISYSIAPGMSGTVTLGQGDSIATPLATLAHNRPAAPVVVAPPVEEEALDPLAPADPRPEAMPEPLPADPVAAARPSFNCGAARTAGELAVCDSPPLAALDRAMAAQYRGALAAAGPDERRLLVETRDRFLAFRDRCDSEACIATAYRGRMREIDDIVAGRWRPVR